MLDLRDRAGVASTLGFIICICFTKLYGMFREKYKTMGLRRSSTTAVVEDNTESLEMVTQSPRPDERSLPHLTVSNQPLEEMSVNDPQCDSVHSGQRITSSLPDTQSFVKKEGNSTSHLPNNCSEANFASSEPLGNSRRIYENSGGTTPNDGEIRKTHAPSTVVGSGPSLEITYCSLDDVYGATSKNEMEDLPLSSTPIKRNLRVNDHKDCKSPSSISEGTLSHVTPTNAQEDVSVKPMVDVEALYMKPDMTRKTKKTHRSAASRGVTKQQDQGDKAHMDDDWGNMGIAMNQTNRVAENDVDPDVLVDIPIYGNSASILNLEYKSAEEYSLYENFSGEQYN